MPTRPLRRREQNPDGASGSGEHPRRRGGYLIAAAVVLLIGVVLAVTLSGSGHSSSAQPGAIQGSATTVVERRDLIETDTETGTLAYREALNVYGRLAGTVTCVPRAGAIIDPGQVLYRVEGAGVYLFNGAQPVRRAFRLGMSDGADVGELGRDLRAMGYDPSAEIELGDHFSQATERAVKRWQESHGLRQTGEIEFGRIVFQPGPRRVEKVNLSLGGSATPQASASPEPTTGASAGCNGSSTAGKAANTAYRSDNEPAAATHVGGAQARAIDFSRPSTTAATVTTATTTAPNSLAGAPTAPAGSPGTTPATPTPTTQTTSAPQSPPRTPGRAPGATKTHGTSPTKTTRPGSGQSRSTAKTPAATPSSASQPAAGAATSGTGTSTQASAPGVALVTTSLQHVVTVALEASKQAEARVGEPVQVTLPSTEVIGGHITNVASVASTAASSASGGASSSSTSSVSVEIALDKRVGAGALDQASVSVVFAAEREKGVLSIPVTALVATGSGGYAVDEVQGVTRKLIAVTPGLYGGSFVAISGVPEGTVVTNASQ